MNTASNPEPSCNHSEPAGLPPWLRELCREIEATRREVRAVREEVRCLRTETDPARNLSLDEAAELAGISRRKLEELIHAGECPSMKLGRRRLVPYRAFKAWLRRKAE